MNFNLPLPLWLVRRIVKRNPWLLAERGTISRTNNLKLGPLHLEVSSLFQLKPRNRERLLREMDSGK